MKNSVKYIIIILVVISLLGVLKYFSDANSSSIIDYNTDQPFYTSIKKEVVATGKLNPEDEIELKPREATKLSFFFTTKSTATPIKTSGAISKILFK